MELPDISLAFIQGVLICLVRVGSMFAVIPIFSGGQVPVQMRIGISFLLSLVAFPIVKQYIPAQDIPLLMLGVIIAQELILGLLVGFLGQLVFMAAEFAGFLVGYKMGFAAANVFDPTNQRQVALIAQFQSVFAILLFLTLDIHHEFLRAIVYSFEMLPPGSMNLSGGAIPMVMDVANHSLILSIQLVTPVLALLILSNLIMGILARTFPQLNVFMLSFPINIGIGFIVMGLTIGVFVSMLNKEFSSLPDRFLQLFNLL